MLKVLATLAALAVGILAGLGLTALSIDRPPGFGAVTLGSWQVRPKIGTADADPYTRALMAANGEIPMGAAEGLALTTQTDSTGKALDGRCRYRLRGPFPGAGIWSVTLYWNNGTIASRNGQRASFTSFEIVRREGKAEEIVLAPGPQPGNWIPLTPGEAFSVVLRLHDLQIGGQAGVFDTASLPTLVREDCP